MKLMLNMTWPVKKEVTRRQVLVFLNQWIVLSLMHPNDDTEDEISDNVDQPFICGHCGKGFLVKINLDAHTSRIHSNQR